MAVHRCPECGGRLYTNYCDICMRKVPFAGARPKKYRDPWEYSSAHREEAGHKCITFDAPTTAAPKQTFSKSKTTFTEPKPTFPKRKTAGNKNTKTATVVAVVLAIMSLLPTVFSIFEDVHVDVPQPEYNAEAFVPEADLPVIQPTGLYSDGEIEIFADSLGMYYDEPALSVIIDNNSEQDVEVMIEDVAVNDYMVDSGLFTTVAAGESTQAFVPLYSYNLELANIKTIGWLDLRMRICAQDPYDELFYIDKLNIETDAAGDCEQPVDRSGWEMIRDSGLSVRLRETRMTGDSSVALDLHLENFSDSTVSMYTTAVYINGQEVEDVFWDMLMPHTSAVGTVYLSNVQDLDINEIEIAYCIEYSEGSKLQDTVNASVRFNPNALPDSN